MDKSKNLYGHLFALTANVMWGLMSPIGKSALQEFSPISVTTFRMVGAAAAFWILSIFCNCLLYTSPSPRDGLLSRMPSSA